MAQSLICDICGQEPGVQMLSNLADGATIAVGAACSGDFYHQMLLHALAANQHEGPRTKCAACRAIHEQATIGATPIAADTQPPEPETSYPADDSSVAAEP
jgi:hypothetical protein